MSHRFSISHRVLTRVLPRAASAIEEQLLERRLELIATRTRRLLELARIDPQRPMNAFVADLERILADAEVE